MSIGKSETANIRPSTPQIDGILYAAFTIDQSKGLTAFGRQPLISAMAERSTSSIAGWSAAESFAATTTTSLS